MYPNNISFGNDTPYWRYLKTMMIKSVRQHAEGLAIAQGNTLCLDLYIRPVAASHGYDTCFRERLVMGYADY